MHPQHHNEAMIIPDDVTTGMTVAGDFQSTYFIGDINFIIIFKTNDFSTQFHRHNHFSNNL